MNILSLVSRRSNSTTTLWVICVATLLSVFPQSAAARIVVNVSGADFRPFPIAAPPVQLLGNATSKNGRKVRDKLTRTLHKDIGLVRALELVPPASYLADPNESWTQPKHQNWVNVGASGLVRCAVDLPGKVAQVSCRFYDVVSQREELYRSYEYGVKKAHIAVHRFLDEVVKKLTGQMGILSSQITFVRTGKKTKGVWVADMDGGNMHQVSQPGVLALLPAWDPTGGYLLFTSYLKGNPDLYRLRLSNKKMDWLSKRRGLNTGGAVSPNGRKVALTLSTDGNSEIYTMDWDGSNLKRLTNSWGQDVSPTWSPDGTQIAFVSSRSGDPHIFVMSANGGNQRRITYQGRYNTEPNWSPRKDGHIVFSGRDERNKFDIFTVDPKSNEITRLTQDEGNNEGPSFSPDGQMVVFTSTRAPNRGRRKLYLMDLEGRNQRLLLKNGEYESPKWGPRTSY